MNIAASQGAIVFLDADNTLWDTDGVFAQAQLKLLKGVENASGRSAPGENRLDFVRQIDQAIAGRHHLGLRFPARLLVQAVAQALAGEATESVAKSVVKGAAVETILSKEESAAIETQFVVDLGVGPLLLPGVEAGVKRLRASRAIILVLTEGNRGRILRTASEYGLLASFDRVIESPKTARLYERVLRLTGRSKRSFMIGDQLRRDIAPAKAAGLTTIYVPSRFRPRWEPDEEAVAPSFSVERFDQAVEIVLQEC
jgi:putative hydrolase of the HAD superfamily